MNRQEATQKILEAKTEKASLGAKLQVSVSTLKAGLLRHY